jgi:hypothetical protein
MLWEVAGVTEEEYVEKFERCNLTDIDPDVWPNPGCRVLLLGEEVRKRFRVPKMLIHPQVVCDVEYRQVPHPSGRCLFYNDPTCRRLVGILLEDMMR